MLERQKVTCFLLIVFGFIGPQPTISQRIHIGSAKNVKSTAFDPKSEILYGIFQDSVVTFSGFQMNNRKAYPIKNALKDFGDIYHPIISDSVLYFIEDNGGIVFQFTGDSLLRIDHSFSHRMQDAAAQFVRNDTIMRYGGYGFWSFRNFFTFFDNSSNGWEQLVPYGSSEFPHGGKHAQVTQDSANVYVLWENYNMTQRPSNRVESRDAWRFHMPSRTWDYLGSLLLENPYEQVMISMGNKNLYLLRDNLAFTIDPIKNQLIYYVVEYELSREDHGFFKKKLCNHLQSFYHNGRFFLLKTDITSKSSGEPDGEVYFEIISESDFLQSPVAKEPLYTSVGFPWKTASGLLFGLIALGGWMVYRNQVLRRDKILIQGNKLLFKKQTLELDVVSISILKLIVSNGGEISNQEVLRLLEKPTFSEGHNLRLKNQIIDSLNLRLRTFLNTDEDLIQVSRSSEDRRNKNLILNDTGFKFQV